MRTRKCPTAETGIIRQRPLLGNLRDSAESTVLQDANIELPSRGFVRSPPEKNVASCLHHSLAFDNASSLWTSVGQPRCESFQYGNLHLLHLKKEGFAIPAHEKTDAAERADRPHPDRFEGNVPQLIPVEKRLPIGG